MVIYKDEAQFVKLQVKVWFIVHNTNDYKPRWIRKMKLNDLGRQQLEDQNAWQQVKHAKNEILTRSLGFI